MFSIIMLLCSLCASDDFLTYPEAYKKFEKSKRPVIIVVTTKSCRHCVTMKNTIKDIKSEYPEFILCEISASDADVQFDFIKAERGVPQTFAYVYDNDTNKTVTLEVIIGAVPKEQVYKTWKMK